MVGPRSLSNSGADDKSTCTECSSGVGSQYFKVNCEYCGGCFHYGCAGFTDPLFTAFQKRSCTGLIAYYCHACKELIDQMKCSLDATLPRIDRLESVERKIEKLTQSVERWIGGAGVHVSAEPHAQEGPIGIRSYASVASSGIVPSAPVITIGDLQKVHDEESHRRSLVIAGLPEQGNDFTDVSRLAKFLDPSATVKEAFRMGRVPNQSDGAVRPRLLKAHLPSSPVVGHSSVRPGGSQGLTRLKGSTYAAR